MTYAISVPTPFNDISELAESFHSRVDEERIMLPNPDAIPEGEWVQFHVTLADGSAALQGQGRCTGSYDNGEDRAAEHRFDIVMDSLELDGMGQIYFERILQVRAAYAGDEPQTGETQVPAQALSEEEPADDLADAIGLEAEEYADVADDGFAYAEPEPEPEPPTPAPRAAQMADFAFDDDEVEELPYAAAPPEIEPVGLVAEAEASPWDEPSGATELGSIEEYIEAPVLATPAESRIYELPPPVAPDPLPSPHQVAEALTRPVLHASWSPTPLPRPAPSESTGYFQYAVGAGLPRPAEPPRPDLDPSMRVARAPRAGDPHAGAIFAEASRAAAEYDEEDYEDEAYDDQTAHEASEEEGGYEVAGGASWEDEGDDEPSAYGTYGDESTLDADGYTAGNQEATRQVDIGGLPEDIDIGDETMQVEIPEES